ncbi:GGDEF domain-containing protein [Asanoa sp. WMMD1127]|uniref:GGDEF domain-containing protein n=1 Tax=Asanoa sp. WMMD1127 TaxID=3016107 RepID=UPI002415BCA4|nr:GGDEF domain-containing protein [Asanoa sp. WMMD1127]MDG4823959.1 GGDEF domain-containing protein [Asanoa sp. WMMD1127]
MSRDGGGRLRESRDPRVDQALRATAVIALLAAGLLAAAGVLGPDEPVIVTILIGIPYAACAAICLRHARPGRPRRAAWATAGFAVGTGALAQLWAAVTGRGEPVHTPTTDGLTVLGLVLLYLFVGLLLQADRRVFSTGIWLDGVVAGFGIGALACLGAPGPNGSDRLGVHLAAALVFIVLTLLVVVGGGLRGRPVDRTHVLVVAAFSAAGIADGFAMLGHAGGMIAEPGYLVVLSLALPTLLAFAPASPLPRRRAGAATTPSIVGWATLAVPAFFAVSSVLLLTIGQSGRLPALSGALAAVCVLAAFARASLTFRELRDLRDVHQQARTDDLTGLPNRRALYEHLEALTEPASLLLLDLDGFKEVNDSIGHAAGDQVLAQTAERIKAVLGPSQVLARLGGDEFAILLPGATLAEAADLAWRIHVAVTCPSHVADTEIRLGVSIGVTGTHLSETGAGSGELLRTADIAMYVAKRRGGGVAAYEPPALRTPELVTAKNH